MQALPNHEESLAERAQARARNGFQVNLPKSSQSREIDKGTVHKKGQVFTNNANQPRKGGKPRQAAKPDKWTKSGSRIIQGKEKSVYTNPKYPKQVRVKTMPVGSDGRRSAVYVVVNGKK